MSRDLGPLTRKDAACILDVMETNAAEYGNSMPHEANASPGDWPPYRDDDMNRAYLKVLALAGKPIDPSWSADV